MQPHREPRRRRAGLLGLLLAACAAAPTPPEAPDELLAKAETAVAAGNAAECLRILEDWDRTAVPRRLVERYDVAHVRALVATGERWDAFEVLRKFFEDHPRSELRGAAVELQWRLGKELLESDGGFLFFWSDRRAGRTVLEDLVTRHPDSPELADALRLLGDLAYEDGDYILAQDRFRELMRWRPESEWAVYARYRFAMSMVESLQGPDYDLDRMQHAERELREFLATAPENPEFVAAAQASLEEIKQWQAQRHLDVAHFYRTLRNDPGHRLHLQRAADERFLGTPAHDQARLELARTAKARGGTADAGAAEPDGNGGR